MELNVYRLDKGWDSRRIFICKKKNRKAIKQNDRKRKLDFRLEAMAQQNRSKRKSGRHFFNAVSHFLNISRFDVIKLVVTH